MKKYVLFSLMLLLGAMVFSTPVVAKFEKIPHEKSFVKKAVESVIVASFEIVGGAEHAPPLINEAPITANDNLTTYNFTSERFISETVKPVLIERQVCNSLRYKFHKTAYNYRYRKPDNVISNFCYHLKA